MTGVLFSGGLDSAVLLALELGGDGPQPAQVQPIHVRAGLAWEEAEARAIQRVLAASPFAGRVAPVATITVDMRDVYPASHWAVTGHPPAYDTPDEDVYLEGRNIVLVAKAAVLCARLGVSRLALGTLSNNPFPDATPEFFDTMSKAMALGLARPFTVVTPLTRYHKEDVVRIGRDLGVPFALTLSCMNPQGDDHCGRCSKCRERIDAFMVSQVHDPTKYRR